METLARNGLSAHFLTHFVLQKTEKHWNELKRERGVLTHSFSVLVLQKKSRLHFFILHFNASKIFYGGLDFMKTVQCFKKCYKGLFYAPWEHH